VLKKHDNITDIYTYMRCHAALLGERILQKYPALHQFDDAVSPRIEGLIRKPFPAQTIAIMGVAKRWQQARTAMVVAECGTGKALAHAGRTQHEDVLVIANPGGVFCQSAHDGLFQTSCRSIVDVRYAGWSPELGRFQPPPLSRSLCDWTLYT
jgi:hypothetical protein